MSMATLQADIRRNRDLFIEIYDPIIGSYWNGDDVLQVWFTEPVVWSELKEFL